MKYNEKLIEQRLGFAAFIIWPNGEQHIDQILQRIEKQCTIEKIFKFSNGQLPKIITAAYNNDYAPLYHLRKKLRYLKSVTGNTTIIFTKVNSAKTIITGHGKFRHIENSVITQLKNNIRVEFNQRANGQIDHNHIIHGTDNSQQANDLLQFVIEKRHTSYNPNLQDHFTPHHLKLNNYKIVEVNLEDLLINVIRKGNVSNLIEEKISNSPHYEFCIGNRKYYKNYIQDNQGWDLTDYYAETKFEKLINNFSYLDYCKNPIIVKALSNGFYQILDGAHRASILYTKEYQKVAVCKSL